MAGATIQLPWRMSQNLVISGIFTVLYTFGWFAITFPWMRGHRRWLAGTAFVALVIGWAALLIALWVDPTLAGFWFGGSLVASLIGIMAGHVAVVTMASLTGWKRFVQFCAIGMMAICLGLSLSNYFENNMSEDLLTLLFGCAIMATLAVPILAASNMLKRDESNEFVVADIQLACPQCHRTVGIKTGSSACPHCALQIHIRLEPPRCQGCDYLLFNLSSSQCPECGQTIKALPDVVLA